MPVTRTALRSSLGENGSHPSHGPIADLPVAKTREVRQAAMGSPYAPASSKAAAAAAAAKSPSSSPTALRQQASRGSFGAQIHNGLPSAVRARYTRTESMPLLSQPIEDVSESSSEPESASPIAARTRTACKQTSTTTSTTSSSQQRRSAGVKRSAADAASSNPTSSGATGQSGTSSTRRSGDAIPTNGQGGGDDDDDDDDPRRSRRRSSRLGGCSSQPEARHDRDDSNKENIAPFNPHARGVRASSAVPEIVTAGTAATRISPRSQTMTRRSVSSPVINLAVTAEQAGAPSVENPRRSSRRGLNRTESQASGRHSASSLGPRTPVRRSRGGPLSPAVNEASAPASPFAHLNIGDGATHTPSALVMLPSFSANTSLADDGESSSYFSQGSASVAPSIFDSTSQFADEDFEMDDLSLVRGASSSSSSAAGAGYLASVRRRRMRGVTADGSQDSSVYSRESSLLPDGDEADEDEDNVVGGKELSEAATESKELAEMAGSTPQADAEQEPESDDAEMQDVEAEAVAGPEAESECTAVVVADVEEAVEADVQRYPNVYAHARALLQHGSTGSTDQPANGSDGAPSPVSSDTVAIVGRDAEADAIRTFLAARLDKPDILSRAPALPAGTKALDVDTAVPALYLCGQPGTGKTALVQSLIAELRQTTTRVAFVNCMSLAAPRLIFGQVLRQLGAEWSLEADPLQMQAERVLEEFIRKSEHDVLIVLDEIDHLLAKGAHQAVLQRLFCIGSSKAAQANKKAKTALIGIANSLDLTERFMPLLIAARMAPTVLHMQPFLASDIVAVVRARLSHLHARYDGESTSPVSSSPAAAAVVVDDAIFSKLALDLASKRIAAATGDLRKALDVCRGAVELLEAEQRQRMLNVMTTDAPATAAAAAQVLAPLTPATAPRVMPMHVLRVFGGTLGAQAARVRGLGMHAKFWLGAFLVALRRRAEGLPVLGCGAEDDRVVRAVGGPASRTGAAASSAAATGAAGSSSSSSGALRFTEVEMTYAKMLQHEGSLFAPLERSELLQVIEGLEVAGLLSVANESAGNGVGGSSSSGAGASPSSSSATGSGSGKRGAAKKVGPTLNRVLTLLVSPDDVRDGIVSVSSADAKAGGGGGAASVVAETVGRMLAREEVRIERSRGWEAAAAQSAAVKREELGGGRGCQAVGL